MLSCVILYTYILFKNYLKKKKSYGCSQTNYSTTWINSIVVGKMQPLLSVLCSNTI